MLQNVLLKIKQNFFSEIFYLILVFDLLKSVRVRSIATYINKTKTFDRDSPKTKV